MTEQEKRTLIARACDELRWTWLDGTRYPDCPDYFHDLNAVQRAERYAADHLLDAAQWTRFGQLVELSHPTATLRPIDPDDAIDWYDFATILSTTTAAQRAEALGKTLNLWS